MGIGFWPVPADVRDADVRHEMRRWRRRVTLLPRRALEASPSPLALAALAVHSFRAMRSLRGTIVALVAALGGVGLAGLVEIGCGDDSSSAPVKAAPDATADGEAGGDSASQVTTDSGRRDGTPSVEADAAADGASPGLDFARDEATAFCRRWLGCCPDGLDGGAYDLQRCIDSNVAFGWEGNLPADPRVYSRGHITVDEAKAAECISALQSFPCGTQTPTQWGAVTSACQLVIQGTIPSNSPGCISSFECAPGNYCDPTVSGGLCTRLATKGQPCNTKINDPALSMNPLADEMCSYLSSGKPALFCDLINNAPDAATCQPLLANGASCSAAPNGYYDDQACAPPSLCGDNLQCGGTTSYPYVAFCQYYGVKDAGESD